MCNYPTNDPRPSAPARLSNLEPDEERELANQVGRDVRKVLADREAAILQQINELPGRPRMTNDPDPPLSLADVAGAEAQVRSGTWPPLIPKEDQPMSMAELMAYPPAVSNEDYPRVFNPDDAMVRTRLGASIPFPPPPGAAQAKYGGPGAPLTSHGCPDYARDYRALQNSEAAREAMAKHAGGPVRIEHPRDPKPPLAITLPLAELKELIRSAASRGYDAGAGWTELPIYAYVSYLALFVACLALGGVIGLSLFWNGVHL